MIQVVLNTNFGERTVTTSVDSTPAQVLESQGINTTGAVINIDGKYLKATDLGKSFGALGVQEGKKIYLTSVVKANGANK